MKAACGVAGFKLMSQVAYNVVSKSDWLAKGACWIDFLSSWGQAPQEFPTVPKVQGVLEYQDLHFQRSALVCMSESAESHGREDPGGNM